jgi:hypothetical protein
MVEASIAKYLVNRLDSCLEKTLVCATAVWRRGFWDTNATTTTAVPWGSFGDVVFDWCYICEYCCCLFFHTRQPIQPPTSNTTRAPATQIITIGPVPILQMHPASSSESDPQRQAAQKSKHSHPPLVPWIAWAQFTLCTPTPGQVLMHEIHCCAGTVWQLQLV